VWVCVGGCVWGGGGGGGERETGGGRERESLIKEQSKFKR